MFADCKTSLTKGYWILRMPIPYEAVERYLSLLYTVGTTHMTAGAFDAWISSATPETKVGV